MSAAEDRAFHRRAVETSIYVGLIALLVIWCFLIVSPFIHPIVWGIILAIAMFPLYQRVDGLLGGRGTVAATVLVVGLLLVLLVPSVMITRSLVESATGLASQLSAGQFEVPPPPAQVADWPIIGQTVFDFWEGASQNLMTVLGQARPQLVAVGQFILAGGATAGFGIVMFGLSIVIAGVLLSAHESATTWAQQIARRLLHDQGDALVELVGNTVQSVTRGILGVALIQSILAGIGFLAANVPAAGLWTLLVLFVAVIQIPTLLVFGPILVYVFAVSSTAVAVALTIWLVIVGLCDNVLKPILLGRGVDVPMMVIFMGAIGGFILQGIIGLFVGAVVLAVSYKLLELWLEVAEEAA